VSTTKTTFTGKKGDLRIGFGYRRVPGLGIEPTMYLWRAEAKNLMVDIPGRFMYLFDERDREQGKEPRCMPKCREIAEMLYGMMTKDGATRVLDAVSEFMTDLKNMPPPNQHRDPEHYLSELKKLGYDHVDFGDAA
jgi:hypothetical protein